MIKNLKTNIFQSIKIETLKELMRILIFPPPDSIKSSDLMNKGFLFYVTKDPLENFIHSVSILSLDLFRDTSESALEFAIFPS